MQHGARSPFGKGEDSNNHDKKENPNMKTISLLAAMFLTAALSGPAAEAGKVPFKGTIEANESMLIFGDPPLFSVLGSGTANTTQLGQFRVIYTFIALLSSLESGEVSIGAANYIAANGVDIIYTYTTGVGSPTGDPDVTSVVEMHTIAGGTGRYVGAKGSFTLNRLVNDATGVSSGSFKGSIIVRGNQ